MTNQPHHAEIERFFVDHVPEAWRDDALDIQLDGDEILVVVPIAVGDQPPSDRIAGFREETRDERVAIASEAQSLFRRKVSWGARAGGTTTVFTSLGVPVMTRLRLTERQLLDTLVEGGVARSRSDALAWCVKLVARHQAEWITDLREALVGVREARSGGPSLV